ncbi:uncharacterized protein LOC136080565 isoform X2 [Hydra vulgaris]|uniref:Uncharacterized protein LOC136080565 isoform X2 n=1 Tax=Hydra vulgaris TaxID=6087 RepID=A0ABM4BW67_HYDVU
MIAMENPNRCGSSIAIENAMTKTVIFIPPVLQVEESLLSLGSHGNVDGIFHCLLIKVDVLGKKTYLARYFEFGSFTAFFENVAHAKLKQDLEIEEILPYCAFTIKDVEMEILLKNETFVYRTKSRLFELLSKSWFFVCQPSEKAEEWEKSLMLHRSNPKGNSSYGKLWTKILELPTLENQFSLLSDLPNHHKWMWDKLTKILRFEQKFSTSCRYFPGSPRNRILQALFYRNNSFDIIKSCLKNTFNIKEPVVYPSSKGDLAHKSSIAKKIRLSSLEGIVDNSDNSCCGNKFVSKNIDISNSSNEIHLVQHLGKKNSLYEYFCAELFSRGVISWRVRRPSLNICVMNNYNRESGNFQDKEFVHVKAETINSSNIYNCSCKTFSTIIYFQSDDVTNVNNCCHCRLLHQLLQMLDNPDFMPENNLINKKKLIESLCLTSNVFKLASKSGIERYSVVSDSCTFITVFELSKLLRKVVKCHDSLCQVSEGSTRQVNNLDKGFLCSHLKVFREHFYLVQNTTDWISNYQDEFTSVDELEDKAQLPKEKWEDVFDVKSGLWTFGLNAPSKKTVSCDQFSHKFSTDIVKRQSATNGYSFMPSTDLEICKCGAGWVSGSFSNGITEFCHKINMYTDREVVECDVYLRKCLSNNCTAYWDGWEDSVFCLSKSTGYAGYELGTGAGYELSTGAGYELGWEFVDFVLCKGTFSGFVNLYVNKYKRRSTSALPFMSTQTFIDWFFAWASHMHIDFRQKCQMCPEDQVISVLACDATKIGISFKNSFVKPIETAELNEIVQTSSRRFDRSFIYNSELSDPKQFSEARAHLKKICLLILSVENSDCIRFDADTLKLSSILMNYIPAECIPSFQLMVSESPVPHNLRWSYAKVFKILAADSSLDSLIPLRFTDEILLICEQLLSNVGGCELSVKFCYLLRCFSPELAKLVELSSNCNNTPSGDIVLLIQYCCNFVKKIHFVDVPPKIAEVIKDTYNPPRFGRAYYFEKHGCQIRKMRMFSVDKSSNNNLFDDIPSEICNKLFPQVSKKGVSFLFLWFCPMHGHCYGFHIIPGSEGRKDPHASLYTHCEIAPKNIFYDFACSLSEFCHNRESGFFRDTSFFHDVFHGYTHKCADVFRCNRLGSFYSINTSICEQFNSFFTKYQVFR